MKIELTSQRRNAFVLDHQHGRRDVTCKPAIECFLHICETYLTKFMLKVSILFSFLFSALTKNAKRYFKLDFQLTQKQLKQRFVERCPVVSLQP